MRPRFTGMELLHDQLEWGLAQSLSDGVGLVGGALDLDQLAAVVQRRPVRDGQTGGQQSGELRHLSQGRQIQGWGTQNLQGLHLGEIAGPLQRCQGILVQEEVRQVRQLRQRGQIGHALDVPQEELPDLRQGQNGLQLRGGHRPQEQRPQLGKRRERGNILQLLYVVKLQQRQIVQAG